MSEKPTFPAVFATTAPVPETFFNALNKATKEWELRAARGECEWICSDCCGSSATGMPDECFHGNQWCTDIIKRDKEEAAKGVKSCTPSKS